MGVKIRDTLTADGKRLEKTLRELGLLEVRVGIQQNQESHQQEPKSRGKKEKESKKIDEVSKALLNELGTVHMPSRPFLRNSVDTNMDEINNFLQIMKWRIIRGASAKDVLKKIGDFQAGLIRDQIMEGNFAPNAEATIRKKKSDTPLVDSGRMKQSIHYVIQPKGGPD